MKTEKLRTSDGYFPFHTQGHAAGPQEWAATSQAGPRASDLFANTIDLSEQLRIRRVVRRAILHSLMPGDKLRRDYLLRQWQQSR